MRKRRSRKTAGLLVTAKQSLGLLIRSKFSIAEICEKTKWGGMDAHALMSGNLELSDDDYDHINKQLNIDVSEYRYEAEKEKQS